MTEPNELTTQELLKRPRPWAFTRAELTASLRRHTGDPSLNIVKLSESDLTQRRPAIGRLRGLQVSCEGNTGKHEFNLILKEPQGSTRAGTAGAALREVSVYQVLGDHLPVRIPQLFASDPAGGWLVIERLLRGRQPENWQAADYLLATDQLVVLHDRFWGLGEDLITYNWLGRPLDQDFFIHLQAARTGAQNLQQRQPGNQLGQNKQITDLFSHLIAYADQISRALQTGPMTLLHGDYWPGNINVHSDGSLTVYDWEKAAIGPPILDLLNFVKASFWWFEPLPISQEEIVDHYRTRIKLANGYIWKQAEWEALWDYAKLWTFMTQWLDLLATIPDSVLESRIEHLETAWLKPVMEAAERRLPRA
jgi:hypothetical protein